MKSWLFSLVVKYLFRVQVAPVRFREEPNIFDFLFSFFLFFFFLSFFFTKHMVKFVIVEKGEGRGGTHVNRKNKVN